MTPRIAAAGSAPADAPATGSPCACFGLRSLTRRVTQLYDEVLAPAGITVTQFSLLAYARDRPLTVSELARRLNTDRTTLTRNLKPLIAAGYVRLAPGEDARRKTVLVTAAGEAAFQAARPLWKQAQAHLRERAGPPRVAAMMALVDDILPRLR
jgi:DNA-binding MarR family transcriptional regulator